MNAMDLVLTLVFSSVMLLFMSVPAMKVSDWIVRRRPSLERWHTLLVLFWTLCFSLLVGLYLRFG